MYCLIYATLMDPGVYLNRTSCIHGKVQHVQRGSHVHRFCVTNQIQNSPLGLDIKVCLVYGDYHTPPMLNTTCNSLWIAIWEVVGGTIHNVKLSQPIHCIWISNPLSHPNGATCMNYNKLVLINLTLNNN